MLLPHELGWYALAALVLVLTPGPNMIYCISRTLCQGRLAVFAAGIGTLALCVTGLALWWRRRRSGVAV